jgi:hypothetical protein
MALGAGSASKRSVAKTNGNSSSDKKLFWDQYPLGTCNMSGQENVTGSVLASLVAAKRTRGSSRRRHYATKQYTRTNENNSRRGMLKAATVSVLARRTKDE